MLFPNGSLLCCRQFIACRGARGLLNLCSVQIIHAFVAGRKYRTRLLPFRELFPLNVCSKGSLHRRILQMGWAVDHPCLRLLGVHRGHQGRVP